MRTDYNIDDMKIKISSKTFLQAKFITTKSNAWMCDICNTTDVRHVDPAMAILDKNRFTPDTPATFLLAHMHCTITNETVTVQSTHLQHRQQCPACNRSCKSGYSLLKDTNVTPDTHLKERQAVPCAATHRALRHSRVL